MIPKKRRETALSYVCIWRCKFRCNFIRALEDESKFIALIEFSEGGYTGRVKKNDLQCAASVLYCLVVLSFGLPLPLFVPVGNGRISIFSSSKW